MSQIDKTIHIVDLSKEELASKNIQIELEQLLAKKSRAEQKSVAFDRLHSAYESIKDMPKGLLLASYQAHIMEKLDGSAAQNYIRDLTNYFKKNTPESQHLFRQMAKDFSTHDNQTGKKMKQFAASYLTNHSPEYFDLVKNEEKAKKARLDKWLLEQQGKEIPYKIERNINKANWKHQAIDEMRAQGAAKLREVYRQSVGRHEENIENIQKEIKSIQAGDVN